MKKVRLDILVQRRAGVSISKAQGLIYTGNVFNAQGEGLSKPGQHVAEDLELIIEPGPRYVSRGGVKLEAAIKHFAPELGGVVALDAGASTGGFTDCLLQHGAAKVYAVDVGYGQLDWKLRQDPRVVVLERTNIRHLTRDRFEETPSFFTVDCSFISLRAVLPPVKSLLPPVAEGAPPAEGIVLIKPQFEARRDQVEDGGVVRDTSVHEDVIDKVMAFCRELGFTPAGVIPSPLVGPAGNKEFLALLRLGP